MTHLARADWAALDAKATPEHPTPIMVLDTAHAMSAYREFETAFPGAAVCYALKANPHPAIVEALAHAGAGFESASWGEIELLQSLGIAPDRIVYGTAVKPRTHVRRARAYGIDLFAADSSEELYMLAEAAPGSRIFIRVKGDDAHSVFRMGVKFGAPLSSVTPLLLLARDLGLSPWGVSFNVGSQASRLEVWAAGVAQVRSTFVEAAAQGVHLSMLNLGGGFPAIYQGSPHASLETVARLVARELVAFPYPVQLVVEPGRRIAAAAMRLIANVIARIERPDGPWLFLDCGVYNALFEALSCQGRTRYLVRRLGSSTGATAQFVLAGPTGDGLDIISYGAELPADTGEGDQLEFANVGAYTTALASSFNGFPIPELRMV